MCLHITLGENLGTGHFYLAKNRTFLLCVDTEDKPHRQKLLYLIINDEQLPKFIA